MSSKQDPYCNKDKSRDEHLEETKIQQENVDAVLAAVPQEYSGDAPSYPIP